MNELVNFLRPLFKELAKEAITEMKEEMERQRAAEEPRYYSREEVAEILHVSLSTLWKLTTSGRISAQRVNGRVLYEANAIEDLVNSGVKLKYQRAYEK